MSDRLQHTDDAPETRTADTEGRGLLPYGAGPEVSGEERGLALLALRAWEHIARSEPLPEDEVQAVKEVLEPLPLWMLQGRFDLFDPEVRRALPARLVESWRFYAGIVAAGGWGEVHVLDMNVSLEHGDVYLVHAVTFAGDGYLEIYDENGAPLASGLSERGELAAWDERFGEVREIARTLSVS